jgi:hypothetical protein
MIRLPRRFAPRNDYFIMTSTIVHGYCNYRVLLSPAILNLAQAPEHFRNIFYSFSSPGGSMFHAPVGRSSGVRKKSL